MMYVTLDNNGLVWSAGQGPVLPSGALEVVIVPPDHANPISGAVKVVGTITLDMAAQAMLSDGYLVPRPASPQPSYSDGIVTIPPCPAGTEIEVFDIDGKELMGRVILEDDGEPETMQFPDAGVYEIEVSAPLPALPSSMRFVVE